MKDKEGEAYCPTCGATDGRCHNEDGTTLPIGQIHRSRGLRMQGIDCIGCHKAEKDQNE